MRNENLKMFMVLFSIGLLSVFMLSCGGSSGGGDDDDDQSLTITGESGDDVNLNGRWSEGCIADDGESEREVLSISGSSFTVTVDTWEPSEDCSGTSEYTQTMRGILTKGEETTASMDGAPVMATEFDVEFIKVQIKINQPNLVTEANTDGACGYNDWVLGIAKDIFDTDCWGDPESFKDILLIDDTVDPDLLYSGDLEGPVDANDYPTVIDFESPEERL